MNLSKRVEQIQNEIDPVLDQDLVMTARIGQLIKEAEKTLGREPLPPLDPSKKYTFEELLKYYRREY